MKTMKLVPALVAACLMVLVGTDAHSQKITIRLGNGASPPNPFYKLGEMWKAEVEKRTNGRVEVQHLHSRQLGEDRQLVESTMAGTIEATVLSTITLTVVAKKSSFEALQLPYLINSYDNEIKVLTSPAAQALLDDLATVGLKGIAYGEAGRRHFLSAKKPVRTLADMQGMKIRVIPVPLHLDIWKAAGTAPVGMGYGEIYTSLQTGVIDGVEINVTSVDSEKLWEPAKYFTYTGHYFWPGGIVYNKAKFDKLPPDIQKAMIEAGHDIIKPQIEDVKNNEAKIVAKLKGLGVKFYEFEDLAEMRKRVQPVIDARMKDKNVANFVKTVHQIQGDS